LLAPGELHKNRDQSGHRNDHHAHNHVSRALIAEWDKINGDSECDPKSDVRFWARYRRLQPL
jgi:hypothetical protein